MGGGAYLSGSTYWEHKVYNYITHWHSRGLRARRVILLASTNLSPVGANWRA